MYLHCDPCTSALQDLWCKDCESEIMNDSRMSVRPVSDWIGCCFELLFALYLLRSANRVGLLLVPIVAHQLIISVGFLLRPPAKGKLSIWRSRLVSYGTYLLVPVFFAVAQSWMPEAIAPTTSAALRNLGTLLWLLGCIYGVLGVWELRYSVSIEPQARTLVTTGPYRFARHPIYASYLVQYAGIFLIRPSVPFTIVLLAWVAMLIPRLRFEETILRRTFPQYAGYASRVGMFMPVPWSHSRAKTEKALSVASSSS
jgi:protein-S-isoprenylcysteine O-methyltransferase Ste14